MSQRTPNFASGAKSVSIFCTAWLYSLAHKMLPHYDNFSVLLTKDVACDNTLCYINRNNTQATLLGYDKIVCSLTIIFLIIDKFNSSF